MATETWNTEGIHYKTKTRFTPAGYDIKGFNEQGRDQRGYDKDGFNERNLDKYGNLRGTGLEGYETRILDNAANWDGDAFRKTDLVPGYYRDGGKQSRDWHFNHSEAFDRLVAKGYIVKSGRRWNFSETGVAKLEAIREARAENSKASK